MKRALIESNRDAKAETWQPFSRLPVDWLRLLSDGRIAVDGRRQPFERGEPILRDAIMQNRISDWCLRKSPGVRSHAVLVHKSGREFRFKYDAERRSWLVKQKVGPRRQRNDSAARPERPVESSIEPNSRHRPSKPVLLARPLFDNERQTEWSLGTLPGIRFNADGSFEYAGMTYGRKQSIDVEDALYRIQRAEGLGRMLYLHDRAAKMTFYFSFNPVLATPLTSYWFRWLPRPEPSWFHRCVAFVQSLDRSSAIFRLSAYVLVVLPFMAIWPIALLALIFGYGFYAQHGY